MSITSKSSRLLVLVTAVLALGTQAGCGKEEREQLAAMAGIASPEHVRASVQAKVAHGDFKGAREEGEDFLNGAVDKDGRLAWALAKACAQLGDRDSAVRYAIQAFTTGTVGKVQLLSEPLLRPVRSDPRLLSLAA